jgi:hypothetical protein
MRTFTDPASGRQYIVDPSTGQSRWVDQPPAPQSFPIQGTAPMPNWPSPSPIPVVSRKKGGKGKKILVGAGGLLAVIVVASMASHSGGGPVATGVGSSPAAQPSPAVKASAKVAGDAQPAAAKEDGTVSQRNALKSAQSYIGMQGFSKLGLIGQLSSSAGDGYTKADATWAVEHLDVDWSEQAVRAGRAYLDMQGFSRAGLIEQLSSPAGDKFTTAQATYAADKLGLK